MEQEFLDLFFEERIAEFCREYQDETEGQEDGPGTEADEFEKLLLSLPEEQREIIEDVLVGRLCRRDTSLYRFGVQDGVRIMLRIMEIRD